MTEALGELIRQEAENNPYGYSWDFIQGRISGGLYWVEKMEGFTTWCACYYVYKDNNMWLDRWDKTLYSTSQLLELYFEQLKKKEV